MNHEIDLTIEIAAERERSKASKAGPVQVHAGMTVAQGFEVIVEACIRHFRRNQALVVERRNPEALHQSRVAVRRLRSALSLFRPAVGDAEFARIRDDLRWFADLLGDARNLDTLLERELPAPVRVALIEQREAAYATVVAAMESNRLRLLMLDIVAWSAHGGWRREKRARRPLEPFARRRINRLWRQIKGSDRLKALDEGEQHGLRIRTKKLRYALEFTWALHDSRRKRRGKFADKIEALQEELGHLHDLVTARSLMAEWPMVRHSAGDKKHEKAQVRRAQRALRKMRKIGRYWRSTAA